MPRGGSSITYGKIILYSESEPLERLKMMLKEILNDKEMRYPSTWEKERVSVVEEKEIEEEEMKIPVLEDAGEQADEYTEAVQAEEEETVNTEEEEKAALLEWMQAKQEKEKQEEEKPASPWMRKKRG